MATAFEPHLSTSALRTPYTTAAATSMADDLPDINFGFDELRERMAKFTKKFDDFIAQGRKRVLEERNAYYLNLSELEEDSKMKQRSIDILNQKASTHAHTVSREQAETAEYETAVASVESERDERSATRDRLKGEIAATQKTISQRIDAQKVYANQLDAQAQYNVPELDFWESYLCMRIETAGEDLLRFIFTHVDEKVWEREVFFELSTAEREYRVKSSKPRLDADQIDSCVDKLNETRDLAAFLKGMRQLFVEALKA